VYYNEQNSSFPTYNFASNQPESEKTMIGAMKFAITDKNVVH
jgi:hypothetical protein